MFHSKLKNAVKFYTHFTGKKQLYSFFFSYWMNKIAKCMIKCLLSQSKWNSFLFFHSGFRPKYFSRSKCFRKWSVKTSVLFSLYHWIWLLQPRLVVVMLVLNNILEKVNISKATSSNFIFILFKSKQKVLCVCVCVVKKCELLK